MFGTISHLHSLEPILVLIRNLLSLHFSALYITPIFHIFEKRTKNLSIPILVLFLLFVNNDLFVSQEKNYEKSNTNLFCSYSIISSLFNQFYLAIEHDKSDVFHFSRLTKNDNPPLLDLMSRSLMVDFILFSRFIFILLFISFSIFRTTRVRVYQLRYHISHKLMA